MAEFDPEPKITECSICHDLYTEPKILPCAHLLCRDCLISWIKTNKQALCPICRAAIIDEHGCKYASFEEIADGLPTDLAMVELINCKKILSKSHVCCAHVSVAASSLCLHCGDMMCQSCGDVHARFTSSRHHTVLELSTLTPEIMVSSKHTPCSSHSDEPSKMYCTVHEVPICLWCSSSNHRSCPEVTSLEEMMKIIKQKLMSMEEKLKRTEYSYDQKIHELEELLKILEENTATAYKAIDNAFNRLQISVEKCRVRLKDRVKDADLKVKAKLKNKSSDLQSKCGIITSHRLLIQRVRESFPCSSMNAIITLLKTRMHNLDLDAVLSTNDESPRVNTFEVDEDKIVFIEEYLTNNTMIQELKTHDSKENHATEESFQQQKESLDSQEVSLYSHTTDFASIMANVFGKDGIGDVEVVENKRSHVLGNLARNTLVISTSVRYSKIFIQLKNHQMKFLSHPKAMSKLKAQCPDVDIYLDETAGRLILEDPENVQIKAKSNILSFIMRISEKRIPLSPAQIATYRRKDSQEYVNKVLDEEKLVCHWEVSDTCIRLFAEEDDHYRIDHIFPIDF